MCDTKVSELEDKLVEADQPIEEDLSYQGKEWVSQHRGLIGNSKQINKAQKSSLQTPSAFMRNGHLKKPLVAFRNSLYLLLCCMEIWMEIIGPSLNKRIIFNNLCIQFFVMIQSV